MSDERTNRFNQLLSRLGLITLEARLLEAELAKLNAELMANPPPAPEEAGKVE